MQVDLDFIPDGFRHLNLAHTTEIMPDAILTREGDCFAARVLDFDLADKTFLNHIHLQQQKHYVQPGHILPCILSYRRSMMELASLSHPYQLRRGDQVCMLGGDGYAGSYQCILPAYGQPVAVEILGGIAAPPANANLCNTLDCLAPRDEFTSEHDPVIIAVVGVRMDSGKSTVIRRLAEAFKQHQLKLAGGKVTGFGCLYETRAMNTHYSLDFTDFGLPSTCGREPEMVVKIARHIVESLKAHQPDVIMLEFGAGIISPYQVKETLACLRPQIDYTVLVAFDLCGVKGALAEFNDIGLPVDLISGPVANTSLGRDMIEEHFGLPSASSLDAMRVEECLRQCGAGRT
jgi:hypothetical protein